MNRMLSMLPGIPRMQWEGVAQYVFFDRIFAFIDHEIQAFQHNVLQQMLVWVSSVALVLGTAWIMWQGVRILSGQARNVMELMVESGRVAVITTAALTMSLGGSSLYGLLAGTLPAEITRMMTGREGSAASQVDRQMRTMEAVMVAFDALDMQASGDLALKTDTDRAQWMAGVGVAGPALVGGALQVTYKMALALFVAFAPLFILCLMFRSTQQLFHKWLLYGVGTLFSFALMAFMAVMVAKIVVAVAAMCIVQYVAAAALQVQPMSVSSTAMLQGGIGLLLTLSLVTVPPMAAYFFQGTLGSYMPYSYFGGRPGALAAGERPGEAGYRGGSADASAAGDPPAARHVYGTTAAVLGGWVAQADVIKRPGGAT